MKNTSSSYDKRMEDEDEVINVNINMEEGIENKKSAEGIMKRIWSRQCRNLEEQRLLQKCWIESSEDPDVLEFAFRQSVLYDKMGFAYVLKVIGNKIKEKDLAAAKKREHKLSIKKIEDAQNHKPDPEMVAMLRDTVESLKPGRKKKPVEPELSKEKKLDRRRSEDEFKLAVKEGNKN